MLKILCAAALLFAGTSVAFAYDDQPTTGNLLGDARLIITSNRKDIRIWPRAPRVLVFADEATNDQIRLLIDQIDNAVTSPFGDSLFEEVVFETLPEDLGAGQQGLWFRIRDGQPYGSNVELNLGEGFNFKTDIVVVVAERSTLGLMNGLWGIDVRSNRSQMHGGRSRCFYSARSRSGVFHGAYVTIFPTSDPEVTEECLWEEFLHALGALQDAEGSEYFSFDNQAQRRSELSLEEQDRVIRQKRLNDLALLRALYESGAGPGGSPDIVIDYLSDILDEPRN